MEKFKDQPIILIQVKGMGFSVLVDTSYRYNLLAPYFIDFFHEKHPASPKTIEFHEWLNFNFPTQEAPIKTSLYLFEDIFQKQEGIKRIKCKDNISRGCESVIFNMNTMERLILNYFILIKVYAPIMYLRFQAF